MPENLMFLLKNYRKNVSDALGDRLRNFILYGSYARGDFRQDSDVDIMILADVRPEEVSDYDEFYIASKEEAEGQIQTAQRLIDLVEAYIK